MAAKRSTAHLVPYQFRPAQPQTIVVRTRSSGGGGKKKTRHRRSHHSGHMTPERLLKIVLGGFIAGFAEKSFGASLPSIPLLGKKGTLTIALYFLSRQGRMAILQDAAIAAAGISGYELGSTVKISGDIDGIASQV